MSENFDLAESPSFNKLFKKACERHDVTAILNLFNRSSLQVCEFLDEYSILGIKNKTLNKIAQKELKDEIYREPWVLNYSMKIANKDMFYECLKLFDKGKLYNTLKKQDTSFTHDFLSNAYLSGDVEMIDFAERYASVKSKKYFHEHEAEFYPMFKVLISNNILGFLNVYQHHPSRFNEDIELFFRELCKNFDKIRPETINFIQSFLELNDKEFLIKLWDTARGGQYGDREIKGDPSAANNIALANFLLKDENIFRDALSEHLKNNEEFYQDWACFPARTDFKKISVRNIDSVIYLIKSDLEEGLKEYSGNLLNNEIMLSSLFLDNNKLFKQGMKYTPIEYRNQVWSEVAHMCNMDAKQLGEWGIELPSYQSGNKLGIVKDYSKELDFLSSNTSKYRKQFEGDLERENIAEEVRAQSIKNAAAKQTESIFAKKYLPDPMKEEILGKDYYKLNAAFIDGVSNKPETLIQKLKNAGLSLSSNDFDISSGIVTNGEVIAHHAKAENVFIPELWENNLETARHLYQKYFASRDEHKGFDFDNFASEVEKLDGSDIEKQQHIKRAKSWVQRRYNNNKNTPEISL